MAITSLTQQRSGNVVTITAASSLSSPLFFHWYVDGVYTQLTTDGAFSLFLDQDRQARIDVLDTTDVNFDPIANAPDGFPPFATLFFVRSIESDTGSYRVEQTRKDLGGFNPLVTNIASVDQLAGDWSHSLATQQLDDLKLYNWDIYPIDIAGNEGTTPLAIAQTKIVRTPDAPNFAIVFDPGTTRVTFSVVA